MEESTSQDLQGESESWRPESVVKFQLEFEGLKTREWVVWFPSEGRQASEIADISV